MFSLEFGKLSKVLLIINDNDEITKQIFIIGQVMNFSLVIIVQIKYPMLKQINY